TPQDRARVVAQINLTPPEGAQGPELAGVAQIREQGGQRVVVLGAEGFERARRDPPRFYAVWLYQSQEKARFLGFPDPQPGRNGRMVTQFEYPRDAREYERLVITQESEDEPSAPGQILLSGPLEGTPVNEGAGGAETAPGTTPGEGG
ncbi:MAG: hypothetical protein M3389_02370, partial [Actinomycetota bacterium]|nr:hypothetical protein [Actinomycetota bacterium]